MLNINEISYADDWKSVKNPIYKEEKVITDTPKKKEYGKPLLLIIQLILCALVVISAFGIKTFGGDLYNNLHNWYYETLNDEIFLTDSFEDFSIDNIFK